MKTEHLVLTLSVQAATGGLAKKRFVTFAGAKFAAGTAGTATLGVANADYDAGEQAGVDAQGSILVEAGGAITAGAEVEADADGRAVAKTTGVAAGRARDSATAAGEFIRILR